MVGNHPLLAPLLNEIPAARAFLRYRISGGAVVIVQFM